MENPDITMKVAFGGYVVEAFDWESEDEAMHTHVFTSAEEAARFVLRNLRRADAFEAARSGGGPLKVPKADTPWNKRQPKKELE